jgi:hypothetical protein
MCACGMLLVFIQLTALTEAFKAERQAEKEKKRDYSPPPQSRYILKRELMAKKQAELDEAKNRIPLCTRFVSFVPFHVIFNQQNKQFKDCERSVSVIDWWVNWMVGWLVCCVRRSWECE